MIPNLQVVRDKAADITTPKAGGGAVPSRAGENNAAHLAVAIIAIAVIGVGAGYINVRVNVGRQG